MRYLRGENRYGAFAVPTYVSDQLVAREILAGEVWEQDTLTFIERNYKGGDIVHAGAFFGDFLPALSKTCQGRVWAFEPNESYHLHAHITVQLNRLTNVTVFNGGLSDEQGESKLVNVYRGRALGGESRIHNGMGDMDIKLDRLDNVVPEDRHVSIVHLDVEEHELQALKGAEALIERCSPMLILETVPVQWVVDHGYKHIGKVDENYVLVREE